MNKWYDQLILATMRYNMHELERQKVIVMEKDSWKCNFWKLRVVSKKKLYGVTLVLIVLCRWEVTILEQWSSAFLEPGTGFMEDNLSKDQGGGDGFRMIQMHYIYCALYFYYNSIVIYNEIII